MRQAEMYFFNIMQQLGLLKKANFGLPRMLSYPHRGSILRELVRWQQRTTAPIKRGLSYPYATKLRTRLAGRGEVLGRRPSTPFFSKTPKLADWLQQPPNAASGGCQCRNAPQRVPARHPAPKTRCAALLASVLGHKSQKMQKNTQKAKSNSHVQANTRMQA